MAVYHSRRRFSGWTAAGIEPGSPQAAGAWPAWCGGDFRSHRKPAGPATGNRGLPVKARLPLKKRTKEPGLKFQKSNAFRANVVPLWHV